MAFINDFLKSLAMPIGDLAKWLEEEHQVPVKTTIEKWNELTGMNITTSGDVDDVVDQTINIDKNNSPSGLDPKTCQHVFIAGKRKNQQCTTKPKGGNDRCSSHKNKVKKGESDPETPKKKQVKKVVKSKETVQTDSESEDDAPVKKSVFDADTEEEPKQVTRPQKKISSSSESESESDDEKPTPKKKSQKKVPPPSTDSEEESD
jgi:hypothetical protein